VTHRLFQDKVSQYVQVANTTGVRVPLLGKGLQRSMIFHDQTILWAAGEWINIYSFIWSRNNGGGRQLSTNVSFLRAVHFSNKARREKLKVPVLKNDLASELLSL